MANHVNACNAARAVSEVRARACSARGLQQNLDEEKAVDRKLTEIAEAKFNLQAAS